MTIHLCGTNMTVCFRAMAVGAVAMLLSSCDGIFNGIYDEPDEVVDFGFVKPCTPAVPGTIYVDATDYMKWVYIDFGRQTAVSLAVTDEPPVEWDIAIHRYDVKTNSAAVSVTSVSDFDLLGMAAVGPFVGDTWTENTIVTDMSHMMDGYLDYIASYYNSELSGWLTVDTSSMPPVYTQSDKIYIIRMIDGSCAAVRLDNFMDDSGVKGFMTIKYMYPVTI